MFHYDKILTDYAKANQADIEKDYKDILGQVAQSKAVYKGKPLPFLYYPSVYSQEDLKNFETLTGHVFDLINASIRVFLDHADVRPIWGFSPELEDLILQAHDYEANVPMGRFDFFYYPDGTYRFCELNTDGTSAMNEETPLTDILLQSKGMEAFSKTHKIKRFELYESWVDEVKDIYGQYLEAGHKEALKPYVLIMDFMSKGSPHEFEVFKEVFIDKGFKCDIASPDALDYQEGHLYYGGEKVDIIYRRLVTRDMMESKAELGPLIQGIKANKTCIIGSIKSQIVHTKKYFEALHHEDFRKYLDDDMLAYIDQHIPYTAALEKNDKFQMYLNNKEKYIIKPIDFYASKGVYAGFEQTQDRWLELLEEGLESGYIIQEFCEKSKNLNLYFDEACKMHVKEVNNITGVFVYNEKLKGIFTRAGFNGVISDLNDGYSLSSVVACKK